MAGSPKRDDLERLRPSVAAKELFDSAAQSAGLESGFTIHGAIEKRARKHNVKEVPTVLSERYKESTLLDSMEEMSAGAEQTCLQARLQGLDAQLEAHTRLATAWAEGDLASLRAHPGDSATEACDPRRLAPPPGGTEPDGVASLGALARECRSRIEQQRLHFRHPASQGLAPARRTPVAAPTERL